MYPKLTSDFHMHTHRQSSLAHTYARMHMQNDIPKKGKNKNSHFKKNATKQKKFNITSNLKYLRGQGSFHLVICSWPFSLELIG